MAANRSFMFVAVLLAFLASSVSARESLVHNGVLPNGGKILALLVAGSSGYGNYRHQADVCHAYQILRENGIPKENIIVMMVDDVANSAENPTPGVIINRPGGDNVYKGVVIDYKGTDVNPETFLAVLQGNKTGVRGKGTGRVIKSGPKDHIFINFVDHGAPGMLCFPDSNLFASDLETALKKLAIKKRFEKMVLYVEACESGSMFDAILPDNMNIFVMTAADPRESSYACYYDETRQTYLGDVFSVHWMEDTEVEDLTKETIHHQYELIRSETNTSHVEEYGDLNIGSMVLALFLGEKETKVAGSNSPWQPSAITDAVSSRDVPIEILRRRLEKAQTEPEKKRIRDELDVMLKNRDTGDSVVHSILSIVADQKSDIIEQFETKDYSMLRRHRRCYEHTVQYFEEKCFKISKNPYVASHLYKFANMCAASKKYQSRILGAIEDSCKHLNGLAGLV